MSKGKQTLPAAITNIRDRIRVKENTLFAMLRQSQSQVVRKNDHCILMSM